MGKGSRPPFRESAFLTNGKVWKKQRRIIDPTFEAVRVKKTYPPMYDGAQLIVSRISNVLNEVEEIKSFAAADVIFRTFFHSP